MADHPYLPHLIADPTFGYLFPHRLTLAAFGVPNDYHLRKHYPRLVEGQHYLKIRDADHVERLFYTLVGLLLLADLVNTPQAQGFKQALIAHTQSGGAITPAQRTALYSSAPQPTQLATESPTIAFPSEFPPDRYPSPPRPADPAYLVAQYLQTPLVQALERSVAARVPTAPPSTLPNYYHTNLNCV